MPQAKETFSQIRKNFLEKLNFAKAKGLLPVVIQDYLTNQVLMLAFMNLEALVKTLEIGETHFWSRSKNKLWRKGETSGNFQKVKEILVDCDADSLLIKVEQIGGIACHTGKKSCFYKNLQ